MPVGGGKTGQKGTVFIIYLIWEVGAGFEDLTVRVVVIHTPQLLPFPILSPPLGSLRPHLGPSWGGDLSRVSNSLRPASGLLTNEHWAPRLRAEPGAGWPDGAGKPLIRGGEETGGRWAGTGTSL